MRHFSELLAEKRKAKGFTQQMLAGRIGMTSVQLCKIEKGRCSPTLDTLERIAEALSMPVSELLADGNAEAAAEVFLGPGNISASRFYPVRFGGSDCAQDCAVIEKILSAENRLCELEGALGISHATMLPFVHSFKLDVCDARTAARYMRSACAVGAATFSDLAELLEFRNVRLHSAVLPDGVQSRSYFDGENHSLSIVLAKENTPERTVNRIAYELAWTVLSGATGFKPVREGALRHRFAREFASEFLMPEESVRFTVSQLGIRPNDWTLDMIAWLKSKFNVSAEAFALRLESLGLISELLRQKIRDEIREYYKVHPRAKEPAPRLAPLKIGMRLKLLEAAAEKKRR